LCLSVLFLNKICFKIISGVLDKFDPSLNVLSTTSESL
jgi:hypothetical protein